MDVGQAMMEKLGYSVLIAKCGKEAVHIAKTFNGDIDLVLLDMGLPDIEGKELYPLLLEVRPKLKVIVCSGYSIDGPARDVLDAGAQAFIQKPFAFAELSTKLKQTIERRRYERFKVKEGAIAKSKSDPPKQGQIIDISRGGLAFCYNEVQDFSKAFAELAIIMAIGDFNLNNIPCKTISELELSDYPPVKTGRMNRCGIQFGELTPSQTDKLKYFIQNHTVAVQAI